MQKGLILIAAMFGMLFSTAVINPVLATADSATSELK